MLSLNQSAIELYIYIFYYVKHPDMLSHAWSLMKKTSIIIFKFGFFWESDSPRDAV